MGFFSWECPVCHESIRSHWAVGKKNVRNCILVLPDRQVAGEYDGYGRIIEADEGEPFDIMEHLHSAHHDREVKLYHADCHHKAGWPEWDDAKFSKYARDQGYWFGKNDEVG
jgi:hypothetical protein